MTKQIPTGSKVTIHREYPGIKYNGVTYGHLPVGAQGEVVGHTADGRVMVSFGGEIHTFDSQEALLWEPPDSGRGDMWFTLACRQQEEIVALNQKIKELQAKLEDLHDKNVELEQTVTNLRREDEAGRQVIAACVGETLHLQHKTDQVFRSFVNDMWSLLNAIMRYTEQEFGDDAIWYDTETTAHEHLIDLCVKYGAPAEFVEELQSRMEVVTDA